MTASSRIFHTLLVSDEGKTRTLTLNRPERRNAIGLQMMNELLWALADAAEDPEIRVVVLTGAGASFCAGGDFSQMNAIVGESELPQKGDYADLLLALMRYEKPVIARVNGHAMGGGLGLVAASTFAIASDEAKLGTPEIDVGLFPMMIMAVLSRNVPRRALTELMLTGGRLTAAEAHALGLLNHVVPAALLDEKVKDLAHKLAEKSPKAMALGLRALYDQADLDLASALPLLRDRLAEVLGTDDAREGLSAFLEKRKAVWTGK